MDINEKTKLLDDIKRKLDKELRLRPMEQAVLGKILDTFYGQELDEALEICTWILKNEKYVTDCGEKFPVRKSKLPLKCKCGDPIAVMER